MPIYFEGGKVSRGRDQENGRGGEKRKLAPGAGQELGERGGHRQGEWLWENRLSKAKGRKREGVENVAQEWEKGGWTRPSLPEQE